VVKKNKRILENFTKWLLGFNANQQGTIDAPLLLIDDEADSASVNTNPSGADPTAVDQRIRRSLLCVFISPLNPCNSLHASGEYRPGSA
jgi:hypothetical protein